MIIFNELFMKGFLCFTEKKINFNNRTIIFGNNGSGKSSILDAILFALYGKITRDIDIINNNSTSTQVILDFRVGSDIYNITRTLDSNGIRAIILKNGNEIREEEITELLGSFDEFITKSVIKQDYLKILDYSLVDAYTTIFNINYDNYKKRVIEAINEKKLSSDSINKEINSLQSITSIIKNINDDIKELEDKKSSYALRLNGYKEELAILEERRTKIINRQNSIEEIKRRLFILEKELEYKRSLLNELDIEKNNSINEDYNEFIKLGNKLRSLEENRVSYYRVRDLIELLEPIIEANNKELIKLSEDIKRFKTDYYSNIDYKELRDELFRLEDSKIELEKQRDNLNVEISILNDKANDLAEELKRIKRDKVCKRCNQDIAHTKDIIADITKELEHLNNIIKDKNDILANIITNLRKVSIKIEQMEVIIINANTKHVIEKMEEMSNNLKNEVDILNARLLDNKERLSSLKFDENSYKSIKKRYESLSQADIVKRYLEYRLKADNLKKIKEEINNIKEEISSLNKELKRASIDDHYNFEDIVNKRREAEDLEHEIYNINRLIDDKKQLLEIIHKSLNIEELERSAKSVNDELTILEDLKHTLEESLLEYISKMLISIKPYTDQLFTSFNLDVSYRDNNIIVNGISIDNLSRGVRALIYIILKLGYMYASSAKIIIIDDNLILDKDKEAILVSNIKIPLILLTSQDLRTVFRDIIEL